MLKEQTETAGSSDLGTITVEQDKPVLVLLNCISTDKREILTLSLEGAGKFEIPCPTDGIYPSSNRFRNLTVKQLKVSVEAPPNTKWSTRIMQ